MSDADPINVLILCTGNSARSILGEALFKHLGQRPCACLLCRQQAVRHGQPGGAGNSGQARRPLALTMCAASHGTSLRRPAHRNFDYIFTVCASAAGETCPIWPGHPTTAHWGIDDPAHVEPLAARQAAFEVAYQALEKRIKAFLALDLESMSRQEIIAAARLIHEACQ